MRNIDKAPGIAVLFAGLFAAGNLYAAELKSLEWQDSYGEEAINVELDGKARITTEELDGGKRLRVSFPDSDVAENIGSLEGRGIVTAVTTVSDGDNVNLDLTTSVPAHISVISTPKGYRITTEPSMDSVASAETSVLPVAMTIPADASGSAMPAAANTIRDISVAKLTGGRVQIKLKMDGRPSEPTSFTTKNPSRIAMDFFNTGSALKKSSIPVKEGALDSITAIQVDDRTRLVFNLLNDVSYQTTIQNDGLVVVLDSVQVAEKSQPGAKKVSFADETSGAGTYSIENIDFRRGKLGEGNIIISLSDPSIGIDINDDNGTVTVDFAKTGLPDELERRLDVIDFATPIQTIDTFREGKGTRMVVKANGKYEQLAYQTGKVFTLSIRPLTKQEIKAQEVDEFGYSGERLSLNFQKIDVRSALQVIADFTGLNIVMSDTVKGNLTLRLQDVPWDQALDLILRTKGLAKREKGNVVWIAPAREVAKREKEELEALKKTRELEPLVSEIIQVNYANAADIAKLLKSIKAVEGPFSQNTSGNPFSSVSVGEIPTESNSLLSKRGNVTVDKRTNTLLIQDTAGKIKEVRKLIAKLDQPVKQVMIETRIVEAADDWGRTLGVRLGVGNYNKDFNFPHGADNSAGQAITSGSLESNTAIYNNINGGNDEIPVTGDGLNVNLPSTGLGNFLAGKMAFTLAKFLPGYGQLLNVEISALEASGKGKIIASPRLITANNEEAHIEQGQERIFTTNVLGVGSVVTKKAVLGLTVTPHITPDNRIIMDVYITKDSFVSAVEPNIDTKQVETQILMDNGETAVIGGIFQEQTSNDITKIPLLGDIPGLGTLFRNKSKSIQKTELLFFLTPKIIAPSFGVENY